MPPSKNEDRARLIRWAFRQLEELVVREVYGEVTIVLEHGNVTRIKISESRHPEKLASG